MNKQARQQKHRGRSCHARKNGRFKGGRALQAKSSTKTSPTKTSNEKRVRDASTDGTTRGEVQNVSRNLDQVQPPAELVLIPEGRGVQPHRPDHRRKSAG